jgi:hypothetical protein
VSAVALQRIHLGLAVLWALMALPTVLLWADSVLYIGLISVYAIVIAHLAAYDAARAEDS